jgi:hypothetical protein
LVGDILAKGTAWQFTYIDRYMWSCRIDATNQSTPHGLGAVDLRFATAGGHGQGYVLAASWARPEPSGIVWILAHDGMQRRANISPLIAGPQTKPESGVAAGDLASTLGGPEASILGVSGRPRFISKAFLHSGGQEIFQKTRGHGCQYVFIVIDGTRV